MPHERMLGAMTCDIVHHAFANMKMEQQRWSEMPLKLARPGTQYVAMVTKLLENC